MKKINLTATPTHWSGSFQLRTNGFGRGWMTLHKQSGYENPHIHYDKSDRTHTVSGIAPRERIVIKVKGRIKSIRDGYFLVVSNKEAKRIQNILSQEGTIDMV